jgi:hypothetical protein
MIRDIVISAVERVIEYYNNASKPFKHSEKEDYPFVLWNESDFRTRLAHELINMLGEDYFIHTEFPLKKGLFSYKKGGKLVYDRLGDKWDDVISIILEKRNRKRNRKKRACDIDLLITDKSDLLPFLICVEVKYIHYDRGPSLQELKERLEILKILKEHGITKDILFVYVDRYKEHIHNYLEVLKDEDVICYCWDDNKNFVRLLM